MSHVDALSRVVASIKLISLDKELQFRQLKDSHLQSIAQHLEKSDDEKYTLVNGLVFKKDPDKPKFVVPEAMITSVIRLYHDEAAHCGIEKTLQGVKANYWFLFMRKKIVNHIENCLTCLYSNSSSHVNEGTLQITSSATLPFQLVHTDHFGPLIESCEGFKHVLILIDAFLRFTWLFPVKTTSSKEVIKHFTFLFNIFGNPTEIDSDRETAFISAEFAEFLRGRQIKHRLVAVAAPWANGLVERTNRFLKSSLRKIIDDQLSWSTQLNSVQYAINNTYHSSPIKNDTLQTIFGL